MASKVFVGNLDFKVTSDQLNDLFAEAGSIREVFLPLDRMSGRPRGFAFVDFESEEEAEKAIELFNDYELSGRNLRVNIAEERPPRPSFGGGGGGGGRPFGGGGGFGGDRPKGSRRNVRAKKRSL
jgi:cold-inducible RNA-binding protein